MKISVIIPAYNEDKYIQSCIGSLLAQSHLPLEIIVVDDGSKDRTRSRVSKIATKKSNIKLLKQAHKGPGAARNLGASKAKGEILVYVDADMEFDKDFLKNIVSPIETGKSKGTFSKDELVKNWDNPWARAWNYNLGLKTQQIIPKNFPDKSPVFRAILKSEFDRVGGFDENRGYDDDWTLSEKLGYQATVAPNAIYYHYNPDTLSETFRQARWRGVRKYKLGFVGKMFTLAKLFFPTVLLLRPAYKTIYHRHPHNFISTIAHDIGVKAGIIKHLFTGKTSK